MRCAFLRVTSTSQWLMIATQPFASNTKESDMGQSFGRNSHLIELRVDFGGFGASTSNQVAQSEISPRTS